MEISLRIVRFYRSWRNFAHTTQGWESAAWVLVDDLCNTATPALTFTSESEVLNELDALAALAEQATSLGRYQTATLQKLASSRRYLLQGHSPSVTREDVESLGVVWEWETDAQMQEMKSELASLEKKAAAHLKAKKVDCQSFYQEPLGSTAAANFLRTAGEAWLARMHTAFPFLTKPNYDCVTVELEGPFQNVVTFEPPQFQLLINSRAERFFTPAHLNFLALHEICGHIQHFTQLKTSRELQTEAPHLLCVAIHTHEALWVEGLAQIIAMHLARRHGDDFPEVLAQVMKMNFMLAVRQNNLMQIIGGDLDVAGAAKRHVEFLGGTMQEASESYTNRLRTRFATLNAFGYHSGVKHYQKFLDLLPTAQAPALASLLCQYYH